MQAALLSMEATPEGIFLLPPNGKRLLVRSLSDGAKYGSSIRKRLAAQENSESGLYSMSESGLKETPFYPLSEISTSSSSSSTCSCGCGEVPSLNEVEVDSSDEDEGFAKDDFEAHSKSVIYVDSAERRSFSSSVDSGRSSDRDGSLNKNSNKITVFVPYCCEDPCKEKRIEASLNRTNITITNSTIKIKSFEEIDKNSLHPSPILLPPATHRRKDLIKLLGLSEEVSHEPRFKDIQKLAIQHLNAPFSAPQDSSPRKKKNLAKFLGVSENSDLEEPIPFEEFKLRVEEDGRSRTGFIRSLFGSGSHHSLSRSSDCSRASLKDYTLQREDGRNHKDLTKFLGLNDSDSEEIIFIQNKRREGLTSLKSSSSLASLDSGSTSCTNHHAGTRKGILLQKKGSSSPFPSRKSVLFKEYDFSVEESIAQGQPVIPPERKRKKDAVRRSVEVQGVASLEELLRDISLRDKYRQRRRMKRRRRVGPKPRPPCPQHSSSSSNTTQPPSLISPKGRLLSPIPPGVLFQVIRNKGPAGNKDMQRTSTKR